MKQLLLILLLAIVPPVPRVGDFVPAKPPEAKPDETPPTTPDDPEATVKRIAETAKAVGDRLKDQDTGTDTRKQQDQLLRDIDSLLKQPPMPPMSGGGGGGGGGGGSSGGGGGGGGSSGGGGGGSSGGGGSGSKGGSGGSSGRQPRGGDKKDQGGAGQKEQPMGSGAGDKKEPMGGGAGDKKEPMGGGSGDKKDQQPGGGGSGKPNDKNDGGRGGKSLLDSPNDDPFTRQVWGHLPEKLRQQASQYYREQYMPKYNDLLKQYYSNLADKEKAPRK